MKRVGHSPPNMQQQQQQQQQPTAPPPPPPPPDQQQTPVVVNAQPVINYSKGGAVQYAAPHYPKQQSQPQPQLQIVQQQSQQQLPLRHKPRPDAPSPQEPSNAHPCAPGNFQRLKVEDALSYLDQVKYEFNNQPQVYNDFLDIMKEFKSQSIDTPGVIARVSNLFKGQPDLIVGFNTFLPPGYKIEVQANDQGYAYQVSVSMPSPNSCSAQHQQTLASPSPSSQHHLVQILPGPGAVTHGPSNGSVGPATGTQSAPPTNTLHHISQAHQQLETPAPPPPPNSASQPVEFNHAIEYVNKIKNRFIQAPEKYKRFLEILHAYQRGQKELKEPTVKQQTEQEVYAQVAKLFENQTDLLMEFGQFLPDATGGGGIGGAAVKATAALEAARTSDQIRSRAPSHPSAGGERDRPAEGTVRAPSPPYGVPPLQFGPPRPDRDPPSSHHAQSLSQVPHVKHSAPPTGTGPSHLKRSPSFSAVGQTGSVGPPPPKKHRPLSCRDVTMAEAAKFGSQREFGFFDRVRTVLRNNEVYDNFLRCLLLYTNEIVSKSELLVVTAPFFCRHPELQRWLQDFLGVVSCGAGGSPPDASSAASPPPGSAPAHAALGNGSHRDSLVHHVPHPHPYSLLPTQGYSSFYSSLSGGERYTGETDALGYAGAQLRHDRPQGDAAMEIDLTTCRRLGTSYCALPRGSADSPSRRCSGRTALCRDVLNETWVSFPTWAEDSTFVTSRKTQFEEYIYRCEDERFELDVVIETNASTILALEGVHKKLCRMSPEEASRFRLDDCLGGTSPTIHQRALKRIYGDRANDIIAGLKKNPSIAVPIVLRRLKGKEEEWREAQKGFNKQWRELNEKYYLKSLDYQGVNFKQNDLKALRSKSLFNEIETAYDERRRSVQSAMNSRNQSSQTNAAAGGPHMTAEYGPGGAGLLADAADLLIHHVRRQTAIQKQEKQRVKQLLRHFLPDLFQHPRHPLSDDERDDDDRDLDVATDSPGSATDEKNNPADGEADAEPKSGNRSGVKQERELSSESDSADRTCNEKKPSNRENKENLNDAKDSSKPPESQNKTSGRRRENSGDGSPKIKPEPLDVADAARTPPQNHKDNKNHLLHSVVFFGSGHWYVFLRLHALLCQRLAAMKEIATELARDETGDSRLRRPATAVALRLKPENALHVSQYYAALLEMVRSVLDGNTEASAYEDNLRDMFGVKAYIAFTLDKVVSYAVRQLQQCVQERSTIKCVDLHTQERSRCGTAAGLAAYQKRAQKLLKDEHAFKILISGGEDCKISFELLDSCGNGNVTANSQCEASGGHHSDGESPNAPPVRPARLVEWARYRERYTNPSLLETELPDGIYKDGVWLGRKAVYLQRNIRKFNKHNPNHEKSREPLADAPACSQTSAVRPRRPADVQSSDDDDDEADFSIKKRTGEDAGSGRSPSGAEEGSQYVNEDKTECLFDKKPNSKLMYILNKEHYVYKRNALKRARKCHKAMSRRQESRWRIWLGNWCGANVSQTQSRLASEWLRRGTRVVPCGGPDNPPYGSFNRYRSALTPPHPPDR